MVFDEVEHCLMDTEDYQRKALNFRLWLKFNVLLYTFLIILAERSAGGKLPVK